MLTFGSDSCIFQVIILTLSALGGGGGNDMCESTDGEDGGGAEPGAVDDDCEEWAGKRACKRANTFCVAGGGAACAVGSSREGRYYCISISVDGESSRSTRTI